LWSIENNKEARLPDFITPNMSFIGQFFFKSLQKNNDAREGQDAGLVPFAGNDAIARDHREFTMRPKRSISDIIYAYLRK
jgi:hypothetical protein